MYDITRPRIASSSTNGQRNIPGTAAAAAPAAKADTVAGIEGTRN